MLKSLYGRLALVLLAVFCVIGALLIYAAGLMFDPGNATTVATKLVVGAILFALAAALVVFLLLTRPLVRLAEAVDGLRNAGFREFVKLPWSDANGDEIGRLSFAVEQMEKRMLDQLERLETIDVQRRELLANVSHDLRTPLASMRGYLETLLLKQGSLTQEEQRSYLEVAVKQSERLGKLVANLFELTKLDAREVTLNPEDFPPAELVQDIAQKFELSANDKGVRIETHFVETLPAVRADIGLIERVLENLIDNALRHCGAGAVVRLGLTQADGRVTVRVSDTGSGIAPQDLPNIFERFYQADRNRSINEGVGLGLAITKRILDLHGSAVHVESQVGVGTTFRFDLPVAAS
jgi:signal transduction histidine kinase